jgi:hypothetical protein
MIFSAKKPDDVALESPVLLTLRDVHPEFAAISDKLQQLCQRESELIAEILPMRQALAAAGAFNSFDAGSVEVPKEEPRPIAASAAAAALLGDLAPAPRLSPAPFIPQKVRNPDADKFAALARTECCSRSDFAAARCTAWRATQRPE